MCYIVRIWKYGVVQIGLNTTCQGVFEHPEHQWIDATARQTSVTANLIFWIPLMSSNSYK
jgi:hypothetical protein